MGTNKLYSATISVSSYAFSHDNSGNASTCSASNDLTAKNGGGASRSFEYSYLNLLAKATIGSRTITNTYGLGGALRIKKTDSQTGSRYYCYNGIDPLCEYDSTGTVKKKYVYALGKCIAFIDSAGAKHFLHHDAVGSVRLVTDASGGAENAYRYYPLRLPTKG